MNMYVYVNLKGASENILSKATIKNSKGERIIFSGWYRNRPKVAEKKNYKIDVQWTVLYIINVNMNMFNRI